jgi:hypothetical protein
MAISKWVLLILVVSITVPDSNRPKRNGLSSPSALRPFLESPDQGLGA